MTGTMTQRGACGGSPLSNAFVVALVATAVLLAGAEAWSATTLGPSQATMTVEATSAAATVEFDVAVTDVTLLTGFEFKIHNPDPGAGTQPRVTAVAAGGWWQGADYVFNTGGQDWGFTSLGYEYPTVTGKTGSGALAHVTVSYTGATPGTYVFTIDSAELVDTALAVIPTATSNFTLVVEAAQAPQPDPPGLLVTDKTTSSITLESSTCSDRTGPVHYQFNKGTPSPGTTFRDWDASNLAQDTALSANTQYTYRVRAKDATVEANTTDWSGDVSAYTLPVAPDVSCDRAAPGSYSVDTLFTFTNNAGWGAGALAHYHYVWSTAPTHTFDGTEATWATGTLPLPADAPGDWYLHVMSHNGEHASGGTLILGPFIVGDPPDAPTAFAHSGNGLATITWTWTDNSGNETGFRVDPPAGTVAADVTTWTETGLSPNTAYTRHVTAYNTYGDSTPSNDHTAYTSIETPAGVSFGTVTETTIDLDATGTLSNLAAGGSGVYFDEVGGSNSGINEWLQVTSDTATDLLPNTQYAFRAMARNGDGDETPFSITSQKYTLANQPVAAALTNISQTSIQANWTGGVPANPGDTPYTLECYEGSGFGGTRKFLFENITSLTHVVSGLEPNRQYSFRVMAHNHEGLPTGWTDLGTAYTLANTPGALVIDTEAMDGEALNLTAPGCRSLSIVSIDLNSNPAATPIAIKLSSGQWLQLVDDGEGHLDAYADSPTEDWHTAAEWAGKRLRGLAPGTTYGFLAKAVNEEAIETALADVGTYSTNLDGDVNDSGSTTISDLLHVRNAVLTGGDIGVHYSWATDVNDNASRQTDVSDMSSISAIILQGGP